MLAERDRPAGLLLEEFLAWHPDADDGAYYDRAYRLLADASADYGHKRSARDGIAKKVSRRLFPQLGLVKVKLPAGPRPTFAEVAEYGPAIVSTRKHLAFVNYDGLYDTHDCSTYEWPTGDLDPWTGEPETETRHRKAQSVWVWPEGSY